MDSFSYRDGALYCDETSLAEIAHTFGTPCYIYSRRTLRTHLASLTAAFGELHPTVCFAVKTCGNIHLLAELRDGGAGADVVSGGELYRALAAGISPEKIVFAGVGKSAAELRQAIDAGIRSINVESESELGTVARIADEVGRTVNVAVRVNPDVGGHNTPLKTTTGTRGSKFGVDIDRVPALFDHSVRLPHIRLNGLHVHLGSPICDPAPYALALTRLIELEDKLRAAGHEITSINMGGGFAAAYETGGAPSWTDYSDVIVPILRPFVERGGQVVMEPGRSIAANAGVLLTKVQYLKQAGDRRVAIVDTGMNNLVRAALYDSFHFMWPVRPAGGIVPPRRAVQLELAGLQRYDIAGPICESTDYLGRDRRLPALAEGDLICIFGAGAYGMSMASQYNATPRPPELLVDGTQTRLIRRRETYADLIDAELSVVAAQPPAPPAPAELKPVAPELVPEPVAAAPRP